MLAGTTQLGQSFLTHRLLGGGMEGKLKMGVDNSRLLVSGRERKKQGNGTAFSICQGRKRKMVWDREMNCLHKSLQVPLVIYREPLLFYLSLKQKKGAI